MRRWLIASDPGLVRTRTALAATLSMGVVLAAEYGYTVLVAPGRGALIAMLVGGISAMQVCGALTQPTAGQRLRVSLWHPIVVGAGLLAHALASAAGGAASELGVFVVVTFCAVAIRRFGPAFAVLGLMAWTGYFMSVVIIDPSLSELPFLFSVAVLSAACTYVLSVTVFRHRPRRALRNARHALRIQSERVASSGACLLADPRSRVHRRRLRSRQAELANTVLLVEGWLADAEALQADEHPAAVRHRVSVAQAAVDRIVHSVEMLAASVSEHSGNGVGRRDAIAGVLRRFGQGKLAVAEREARGFVDSVEATETVGQHAGRRVVAAVIECVELARSGDTSAAGAMDPADVAPAVSLVASGSLPGAASVAPLVTARSPRWLPLHRLSLPTRQALQAALAVGLAIVCGRLLSETYFYWAAIAVFIIFLGPATRGEIMVKACHRVFGTVLGLLALMPLAALIAGNPAGMICLALVSCFLGHYLATVSYSYLMFFITISALQLYEMMNQFGAELVTMRLAETLLGAVIAVGVALILVPVSTRGTIRVLRSTLLGATGELLETVARCIDHGHTADLWHRARCVDEHTRKFAVVAAPLTRRLIARLVRGRSPAEYSEYFTACSARLRQVIVSLHDADPVPGEIADMARALAGIAYRLAETAPGEDTHDLGQHVESIHTTVTTGSAHPARQHLCHIHRLFRELAGLSPAIASARAPHAA